MHAFVRGFGCSLNKSDTEQIKGFLGQNKIQLVNRPEKADCIIINTCAVKEQTETKMLKAIKELNSIAERNGAKLIVAGCLPAINPNAVKAISPAIIQIGPSLYKLASILNLPEKEFSPAIEEIKENPFISIIPIARGCIGNCSYCCVKNARGDLRSYSIDELNAKFKKAIKGTKEIWLTAQDCGCYGFDKKTNLPALLKAVLQNKGDFRIRIGMINPAHLPSFLNQYLALFSDKRLYRFFHIPLQSGSNAVLHSMLRPYKKEDFLSIVKKIRRRFPDATIATDVIAGFPGETEQQFQETVSVLRKTKPDIVNISRFGARPNTAAALMQGRLHGRELKRRSRILTALCKKIALHQNKRFVGKKMRVLVTEKGSKGSFVGRAQNYKPVAIKENFLGKFVNVRINKAFPTYLSGTALPG